MAKILNIILVTFAVAIGTFSIIYYITKQGDISLIVSGIMIIPTVCVQLILNKRQGKPKVTAKQHNNLAMYLAVNKNADSTVDNVLSYLSYKLVEKLDDNCGIYLHNESNVLIVRLFTLKPLLPDMLLNYIKLARNRQIKQVTFLTCSVDASTYKLIDIADDLQIKILTTPQLYDTMNKCYLLPDISTKSKNSINDNAILRYALNKARTKQYLTASIFTMLLSTVSFFPLYLLVWSGILMTLALYSRFNKRYNTTVNHLPL